jgi:hypothetical protein
MVCSTLFLSVMVALIPDHALAFRMRGGPVPTVSHAKSPAANNLAVTADNTSANQTGTPVMVEVVEEIVPMEVVVEEAVPAFAIVNATNDNTSAQANTSAHAMPVLVVQEVEEVVPVEVAHVVQVVAEDDSTSAEAKEQEREEAADGIGPACKKEMITLMTDQTRLMKSMKCEKDSQHAEAAVKQLQLANATGAKQAVVTAFHECGDISVSCARELAPDLVLKMRLTGAAVTKECADVAHAIEATGPPNSTVSACQAKVMEGMSQKLMAQDFAGAIDTAEQGMSKCSGIHHPCDFQLAPVLLVSLMRAGMQQQEQSMQQQEQEIMPVLLHNLEAMEEMSAKLAAHENATRPTTKKSHTELKTDPKPKAAVSLLSVAKHVRIMRTARK